MGINRLKNDIISTIPGHRIYDREFLRKRFKKLNDKKLLSMLEKLRPRDEQMIKKHYLEDLTIKKIALEYNLSRAYTYKLIKEILIKSRELFLSGRIGNSIKLLRYELDTKIGKHPKKKEILKLLDKAIKICRDEIL